MEYLTGELVPLAVPWSLGSFDSRIKLEFSEGGPITVEVYARFQTGPQLSSTQKRKINIQIMQPVFVSIRKAFADDEIDEYHNFKAPFQQFDGDDDQNNALAKKWFDSSICPNPFAYRVTNSALLRYLELQDMGYTHYSFHSDDALLTIVAQQFNWRESSNDQLDRC